MAQARAEEQGEESLGSALLLSVVVQSKAEADHTPDTPVAAKVEQVAVGRPAGFEEAEMAAVGEFVEPR